MKNNSFLKIFLCVYELCIKRTDSMQITSNELLLSIYHFGKSKIISTRLAKYFTHIHLSTTKVSDPVEVEVYKERSGSETIGIGI